MTITTVSSRRVKRRVRVRPARRPLSAGEVDHPAREPRRAENADQGAQDDGTQRAPPT